MIGKKGKKQQNHITQQEKGTLQQKNIQKTIRGRNRERHNRKTEEKIPRFPGSNKRKKHGNIIV
jgi:hypothetical protein